ncbi:MAG TPA: sodium ion-translocating decarboxylase subunit beta, partial [Acholeplasmataceae bacterium]|nr:sodium ion-translocating decarboxylase subunit beta [Acholeplasmataceae bacterium]
MLQALIDFFKSTGLYFFFQPDGWKYFVMIIIALVLLYLAIFKKFEPYLLIPIGFAMLLVNIPNTNMFVETKVLVDGVEQTKYSGLLGFLYYGVKLGIYPPLIFLGIG